MTQTDRTLLFTDIRGKFFEGDEQEGNFALGYREMSYGGWNFGAWAGYDIRRTENDNNFGQVSFGVEALSPIWDFRLNGYVPTKSDEVVSGYSNVSSAGHTYASPTVELSGSNIYMLSGGYTTTTTVDNEVRELAFWGFDGEIGAKVPLTITNSDEFRIYAGGFYFDNDDFGQAIAGPRARAEWRINGIIPTWADSRLTLEGEYQYDEVRDSQFEGGVRLRLPLSGTSRGYAKLTAQERRMSEGLERDTDIIAQSKTFTTGTSSVTTGSALIQEDVKDTITGVEFDRAIIVAGGGGTLQAASDTHQDNTLLIAQGSGGAFSAVKLNDNQTLQGGGSTINVTGLTTGQTAGFTAPGSRPTIQGASGETVIEAADNSHIAGVDVKVGGSGVGVGVYASSNYVVVADSKLTGTDKATDLGIAVLGGATVVDKMLVSNVDGDNLQHFMFMTKLTAAGSPTATINELKIASVDVTNSYVGFNLTGAKNLTISDVTQTGGSDGIYIQKSDEVTVDRMTINLDTTLSLPGQGTGFSLFSGVKKATVTDLSIDGAYTGVTYQGRFFDKSGDAVFNRLTVSNSNNGVVEPYSTNSVTGGVAVGNLTIMNSTFTNIAWNGLLLQFQEAGSKVIVKDTTFTDVMASAAGTAIFNAFQNADVTGSTGNEVNGSHGTICNAGPAAGSIEYSINGGPTQFCPGP